MNALDRSATLAQLVTEHPAAARVFQRHGMDYCCHGNVSVPEACRGGRLEPAAVFAELEEAVAAARLDAQPIDDPRTLPIDALIARIVEKHHGYTRRAVPAIEPVLAKVVAVHGPRDANLLELQAAFEELAGALLPHLDEEEEVLFPALRSPRPDPALVRRELDAMMTDHLAVGDLLARIRTLAHGFTVPEWGCRTYRVLMQELEALEADILRHVHLENHVLVPRVAGAH
ncbi:MAG TPA: iron-sulfur cluster repair di-iron protein [Anaeromyxobacteraceae bacterium]|nr:iron-sulfur cluster repair di-iron protein [Anaeromyxobacteraceae bacterium]